MTDEATAGSQTRAAPGNPDDGKAANYLPNALGNITPYSRSSTTLKVPGMLGGGIPGDDNEPEDNENEVGEGEEDEEGVGGDTVDAMLAKRRAARARKTMS